MIRSLTAKAAGLRFRALAALGAVFVSTIGTSVAATADWLGLSRFFLSWLGVFACSIGALIVAFGGTRHSLCRGAAFGLVSGFLAYSVYLYASLFGRVPFASPIVASVTLVGAFVGGILAVVLELYGRKHARARLWYRGVAVVAVLLLVSLLVPRLVNFWHKERFVALVETSGGFTYYGREVAGPSRFDRDTDDGRLDWLRRLLGRKYLAGVDLRAARVVSDDMKELRRFSELAEVTLSGQQLTDDVISILRSLPKLKWLRLYGDDITDETIEKIRPLVQLELLDLDGTSVTDNGLRHLNGLKRVVVLSIRSTSITPAGVRSFQVAHPTCRIFR